MLDRRSFVLAAAAGAFAPRVAFARAPTDRRFVFIIQRGAADGLGIVMPVGDPHFVGVRGLLSADAAQARRLDGTFAIHAAMPTAAALFARRQALFVHAIASSYRDRSHFDGQNILETGGTAAYQVRDGWMNRLIGVLPGGAAEAVAVAATIPVALRGVHDVASYAPTIFPDASDDLLARVSMLYAGDQQLHTLWSEALAARTLAGNAAGQSISDGREMGALAARLLAPTDGARITMIETGGWDTHSAQKPRLAAQLGNLDAMIAALQAGLGPLWNRTLVLVATEFGRTAAVNGTGGTDHGTGSVAMLLGGGVRGGRVIADWPGLSPAALYDGRDLRPTAQLNALIAGAIAELFGVDPRIASSAMFPTDPGIRPMSGLIGT